MSLTPPTNETRAARGQQALEAYVALPESDTYGPELGDEEFVDLVADLLHYARQQGLDPEAIIRMAVDNFEEESGT